MASPEKVRKLRCAIYTRKSSDEGLDMEFNSLHAQREACAAYILSQKHEGWTALPALYDDGGFSGGSMQRPALKALLADVEAKKIDVIVVYKVDRLTRALADFARIVTIFDAAHVSFVSVTQAFNTTSSMGRLTLNVLLSFAQFEREVTAERIRDKIAASKKKGMWMGGAVPFGYRVEARKLVPRSEEAAQVRAIFERYLALGTVPKLRVELERSGQRSRVRISTNGKHSGGAVFSRGNLYHLLTNPLVIGRIRHKDQVYPDSIQRSSRRISGIRFRTGWRLTALCAPANRRAMSPVRWPGGCSIRMAIRCVPATPTTASAATATISVAT